MNVLSYGQSITWNNKQTDIQPGETIPLNITYDAGVGNTVYYVSVVLQEMNASWQTQNNYNTTYPVSGSNQPNASTIDFNYTIDSNIPLSENLPSGNFYLLKIFISVNTDGAFANDNTQITLLNNGSDNGDTNDQVNVDINFNVKHIVGGISTFDRSKFITIHANQTENEWDGDNFTSDLRDDFLNGYDVYLGRDTGGITWNLNNMEEDPTRPGFADPAKISSKGQTSRNSFAAKTELHQYENRKNQVIAGQLHPFWTGESQKATNKGWKLASPTATGEYMGRYFNAFHGGNGLKEPNWVEVINEPAYEALGGKKNYTNSLQEIADFHVEVADAIRAQNPNLKIGGYTVAFPDFETGDFQRWINRDKLFIDVAGEKMDFWSWHLYDFPAIGGKVDLRSGSNVEATFDMNDQYSMLQLGHTKPYVISEYGAQTHDYNGNGWNAYRDWLFLKAQNSLMMSFMERPNEIAIAIPFTVVKAEWGYNTQTDEPYSARLMRKTNEPDSYTGTWIYSDRVKFYQLWKNVKGTRIDTKASDLDIQVDAYVDGTKAYVILNSLETTPVTINLNTFEFNNVTIDQIVKNHLTWSGNAAVIEEETLSTPISEVVLGAESTMILEYTFANSITIDETSNETKYFATDYLKPITANQENNFEINGVQKNHNYGEAILRVSIGRDHGKTLKPTIKINNTQINVPDDWRGYDQADKGRFFGTLEIPVSYNLLTQNNTISVTFPDTGGHVSSVVLQVFGFSKDIRNETLSTTDIKKLNKVSIYPNPVSDFLHLADNRNISSVHIYNTLGEKVLSVDTSDKIDVTSLRNGVYMLVTNNGSSAKFIKI
ncbi:hypothetical protein AXE80_01580 [Wenyingzhuangia fucanilytica]|uniref:Agarase n=2 Tax=Wenyingzhuangia fucanilytica TaxID=1790137 RepID=A0A1B1Y2R0_9FLAO|nr:hypothetical protein AXE80_01580 [Wenyingzhuangia fucanilytica]